MKRLICLCWLALLAAAAPLAAQAPEPLFRTEARLVQVYATVLDDRGRYIDDLRQDRFRIDDNGAPQPVVAFENSATDLSCAIMMDTTGSMVKALPAVKNAMVRLIDEFRDSDWIATYGFDVGLELLQDFTQDKAAAKKSVLRTRAGGETALFDAISRVAGSIAGRPGKKAIIVFTDGDDNASVLSAQRMVDQAKKVGIPVYTVAEGEARESHVLRDQLKELSRLTGGKAYTAKRPQAMSDIFQDITEALRHTYLLAYRPPDVHDGKWRAIQVRLDGLKDYRVRAKEGYFAL